MLVMAFDCVCQVCFLHMAPIRAGLYRGRLQCLGVACEQ